MFTPQFKKLLAVILFLAGLGVLAFAGFVARQNVLTNQENITLLNSRVTKLELSRVTPTASPSATPTLKKVPTYGVMQKPVVSPTVAK